MEIGERLASLEATVKSRFDYQDQTNANQAREQMRDRGEIKQLIRENSDKCDKFNNATCLRLDMHDDLIQQGRGASKTLTKIGAFFGVIWAGLEALFHFKH